MKVNNLFFVFVIDLKDNCLKQFFAFWLSFLTPLEEVTSVRI